MTRKRETNEREVLHLSPRWAHWRDTVGRAAMCGVICAVFLGRNHPGPVGLIGSVTLFLLASLGPLVLVAYGERRRRPPVMRFWTTGEADLLQVRRQSDDEVLYRSDQPNLVRADLRRKKLAGANLTAVDASWADFRDADLRGANLDVANLTGANLRRACLCGATLTANLTRAKFNDADLRGADLQGSGLTWIVFHQVEGADFRGAIYNSATRWPWGFDPSGEGCVPVESDTPDLPLPAQAIAPTGRELPVPASTAAVEEHASLVNVGSRS